MLQINVLSQPISEVGFLGGAGFIELASQELRRESNFGFTFKTMEANALMMLSTFVGQVGGGGWRLW